MFTNTYIRTVPIQDDTPTVSYRRKPSGPVAIVRKDNGYLHIGIFFLLAFWTQYVFELRWEWLASLQRDETFKQYTGLTLATYIAHQWYLWWLRTHGRAKAAKPHYLKHKWAGVLAPLLFYVHSTQLGHAYLFFMSLVYFTNVAIGFCSPETMAIKSKWFSITWIIAHVSLSVLLVMLVGFHIFVVFIYE